MSDRRKRLKVKSIGLPSPPAVLHFPAGLPPETPSNAAEVYTNAAERFAVAQEEPQWNLSYVGQSQNAFQAPCRYALGVFNARKRSLKLVPVLGNTVIRMEPRIEGLQYTPSGSTTVRTGEGEDGSNYKGGVSAISAFGGSLTKKRLKQALLSNTVHHTVDSEAAIDSIMHTVIAKSREEGLTMKQVMDRSSQSRVLPPHHLDGTTLEEAFVFDEICPVLYQPQLDVQTILDTCQSNESRSELQKTVESSLVLSHFDQLSIMDDEDKKIYAMKLAFLNALLKFSKMSTAIVRMTKRTMATVAHKHSFPMALFRFLLCLFCEERKRLKTLRYEMSDSKRSLLQLYIIVMAFMVNDAQLESEKVDQLRLELKLSKKAIQNLIRRLGAKTKKSHSLGSSSVLLLKNQKPLKENLPSVKLAS